MENKIEALEQPPPHGARDPPYGMPYGWRIKAPTVEEHKQQNVVNNEGAKVPHLEEKLQSLEEQLYAVEGRDKYGLEAVDLCLVSDVGLLVDFKILEFDKYKRSSYPRVHLAMYY
ncbi:hypothetical protein CR513_19455, partial [Mucuna pruriens]